MNDPVENIINIQKKIHDDNAKSTSEENKSFQEKLKDISIDKIKENIAAGIYNQQKRTIAENWVKTKEREEDIKIQKEANKISNEAKEASKFSNKIALAAIGFSLLALIISIFKP